MSCQGLLPHEPFRVKPCLRVFPRCAKVVSAPQSVPSCSKDQLSSPPPLGGSDAQSQPSCGTAEGPGERNRVAERAFRGALSRAAAAGWCLFPCTWQGQCFYWDNFLYLLFPACCRQYVTGLNSRFRLRCECAIQAARAGFDLRLSSVAAAALVCGHSPVLAERSRGKGSGPLRGSGRVVLW